MSRRYYYNYYYGHNKYKDGFDALVIVLFFVFLSSLLKKLLIAAGVAAIIFFLLFYVKPKIINWYKVKKGKEELIKMAKEAGATNIDINLGSGKLSLNLPEEDREKILNEWQAYMSSKGLNVSFEYAKSEEEVIEMDNKSKMKTTEPGYINGNNQKNHGRKGKSDNHYNQWFYEMECLNCGHRYNANGSDIWLRKCPNCQGGRP